MGCCERILAEKGIKNEIANGTEIVFFFLNLKPTQHHTQLLIQYTGIGIFFLFLAFNGPILASFACF